MRMGRDSPPMVAVETSGVANAFNAATFAGTAVIGVATEIPIPSTSWQVEHRPKLRVASENSARPRAASPVSDRGAEATLAALLTPFKLATYATTAARSLLERVVAKAGMPAFATPLLTVTLM